jgi:hypothetical protein
MIMSIIAVVVDCLHVACPSIVEEAFRISLAVISIYGDFFATSRRVVARNVPRNEAK